jgi:hypothetical protein
MGCWLNDHDCNQNNETASLRTFRGAAGWSLSDGATPYINQLKKARPTRPFRTLACDGTIDVDQQPSKAEQVLRWLRITAEGQEFARRKDLRRSCLAKSR